MLCWECFDILGLLILLYTYVLPAHFSYNHKESRIFCLNDFISVFCIFWSCSLHVRMVVLFYHLKHMNGVSLPFPQSSLE